MAILLVGKRANDHQQFCHRSFLPLFSQDRFSPETRPPGRTWARRRSALSLPPMARWRTPGGMRTQRPGWSGYHVVVELHPGAGIAFENVVSLGQPAVIMQRSIDLDLGEMNGEGEFERRLRMRVGPSRTGREHPVARRGRQLGSGVRWSGSRSGSWCCKLQRGQKGFELSGLPLCPRP